MKAAVATFKTWSKYFQAVWDGRKTFELRKLSKLPEVGDFIRLKETADGTIGDNAVYTGRILRCEVTYILTSNDFEGLKEGYSIIGLKVVNKYKGDE